jgi:hypothetical protein
MNALLATPPSPGLEAEDDDDMLNLDADDMPGMQTGPPQFAMIDTMTEFNGRLYLASAGNWWRAEVAAPDPYSGAAADWRQCRPSAAAYTSRSALLVSVTADMEPKDKAVPQMAVFNGNLYAARNTTVGPQLWRCTPALNGDANHCDGGDWALIAANSIPDTQLSQFDNTAHTSITMLVATSSHLYVGYNSASGVSIFRSTTATPGTRADFEGEAGCSAANHPASCAGLGGAGLGDPANQRIFDARGLALDGTPTAVYVTVGNSDDPVRVFRLRP